jgi:uncharacterized protein YgiM (DUF1202 family)
MRKTLMIAAALSAVGALSGNASADLMRTPSIVVARPLLAAADVEMTVSNKYGYANLRQGPSTQTKLLDRLPEGTKVIAIEKVAGGAWIHVKVGDKEGYIQAKLLK